MDARHIPFKKMNGLGNDFVIIDARAEPLRLSGVEATAIADRNSGIGCDQVIVLGPSGSADVFMSILNADGSEAGACGNATRCVAAMLFPASGRSPIKIETRAGLLSAGISQNGTITVDMGIPRFAWDEIPLSRPMPDTAVLDFAYALPDGRILSGPSAANVGNPHCIFWVADVSAYDLSSFGAELEEHPLFPERVNISLAEVVENNPTSTSRIRLRVWERGAGLTRACGTAACAAAVAGVRAGRVGRNVEAELPGGSLLVEWRLDEHMMMTGPAEFEFDGVMHLNGSVVHFERLRAS